MSGSFSGVVNNTSDNVFTGYGTGLYYQTAVAPNTSTASNSITVDTVTFVPLFIPNQGIDRIVIEATTNTAGSLVRFGVYDFVNGRPTNRLLDLGQVDAAGTGYKEVTVTNNPTGWICVALGGQTAVPSLRTHNASLINSYLGTSSPQFAGRAYRINSINGALPSTINPGDISEVFNPPLIWFRSK